jgi:hypothetical protein
MKFTAGLLAWGASLTLGGIAQASDLYNNLANASFGAQTTSNGGPGGSGFAAFLANAFMTGPSGFRVTSVSLLLEGDASPSPTTAVTVSLLADTIYSDGVVTTDFPGATLAAVGSLNESAIAPGAGVYALPTNLLLAANTIYWIQLESNNVSTLVRWDYTSDHSGAGYELEYDGLTGGFPIDGTYPFQMRVSGVAVPEPAAWTLLLFGFGALGGALRGARRKGEIAPRLKA